MVADLEEVLNVAPTTTVEKAVALVWDAIVIGAGPAGAIAAHELSRRGAATLLVERYSFPRAKVCGGCLNGGALSLLDSLHLDHTLTAAHAAPTNSFVLHAKRRSAALDLPAGVAIDRAGFDAALVRAAISRGAEFLSETTATVAADVPPDNAWRTVSLGTRDQQIHRARAGVVLAADGLGHASVRHIVAFDGRRRVRRESAWA